MDFRDVAAALQGASISEHRIDLKLNSVELVVPASPRALAIVFEDLLSLKWSNTSATPTVLTLSTVGLEKLGPGEPWRLYIRTSDGAELELSCRDVSCDGAAVTGVGRSYRH
ncbi:MAG: hypothetical protein M3Z17_11760 [Gemmatimonadota bacterium]|nr:hypothetical protein [Gemmatimonadota bacterium]